MIMNMFIYIYISFLPNDQYYVPILFARDKNLSTQSSVFHQIFDCVLHHILGTKNDTLVNSHFFLSFKSIESVNNRRKELIYIVEGKLHLVSCVLAFQCSFQKCQIKNSNKQF